MFSRYRTLIAALSIALQGVDSLVVLVGHDHAQPCAALAADGRGHVNPLCHHDGDEAAEHGRSSSGHSHSVPGDECSICRHLGQPVAAAAPPLPLDGGEFLELLAVRVVPRPAVTATIYHDARGPPAFCA